MYFCNPKIILIKNKKNVFKMIRLLISKRAKMLNEKQISSFQRKYDVVINSVSNDVACVLLLVRMTPFFFAASKSFASDADDVIHSMRSG